MIIVPVTIHQLLQVVKYLELPQELHDTLIARGEDSKPGDELAHHCLIHTLLGEESLRRSGTDRGELDLRLLVLAISTH